MPVPEPVRDFLAAGQFAHMITLDPKGDPHVSLVWAGVDEAGDELVLASFTDQHKLDNLRRDPRITLSFQAKEYHGAGLYPYLVVRGRGRVTEGGSLAVMDHLAQIYMGPGATFPMRSVPPGFTVRVTPEKYYGVGPWKDELKAEQGGEG